MSASMLAICLVLLAALLVPAYSIKPIGVRVHHQEIELVKDLIIDTQQPHFSWQLDDEIDGETGNVIRGVTQSAYRITIKSIPHTRVPFTYDSGKVQSAQSLYVAYNGAQEFERDSFYEFTLQYWSSTGAVSQTVTGRFRTSVYDQFAPDAVWIGSNQIAMNQVRKEFSVPSNLVSATAFYSGIGHGVLYVNGQRADYSRRNDPGWSTYEKRTFYVSMDVTKMLTPGQTNAVGVELGYGWYSQEQYWNSQQEPSYGPPRLIFSLTLHTNTSDITVVSDTTWMGRTGPRVHDGVYMGTIYDARLVRPGWSAPGFKDPLSLWINASVLSSPVVPVVNDGPCVVGIVEGYSAELTCGNSTITGVVFASFGTPEGTCGAFQTSSCDATSSVQVVKDACVGKFNCSIAVETSTFGGQDPCYDVLKHFSAQVTCAGPPPPPAPPSSLFVLQPMAPIRIGPDALHIKTSAARLGGKGQADYIQGGSLMDGGVLKPVGTGGTGHQVFDLGQNFAGFCMFNVTGPRAIAIHFRHAEVLTQPTANGHAYGDIYTDNLRQAAQTDIFVLAGTGQMETYEAEMTVTRLQIRQHTRLQPRRQEHSVLSSALRDFAHW